MTPPPVVDPGTPVTPPPVVDPTPQIDPNQPLIGVIDTGFSANNPDLDYRRFKLGSDRISNDGNPFLSPGEGNEHGTHILGLIAATQGNGIGIDGINDKAPIWLGRAVGGGNWASSLYEFVGTAKYSGYKNAVVNLSLDLTQVNPDGSVTTRYELTPKEREAIEFARQNHVLIVTAAGNDGGVMSVLGQASQEFDNIITVGASNEFDRANYSSYGAGLDILTEGGNTDNPVLSTVKDGVGMMAGTSVAAARATGVASLIWAANPDLSYRQVIDILELTAVDVKTPGWDAETGAGLLNAVGALELAKKTTPQDYTPFPWVAPFTWDGEGKVTPVERAASGGNTLATAAVQPDPNFSDSDIVDINNREKYYEVTIEQPGYLRYTVTRTNGTEWLPNVEWLRTDGKPISRQFSSSYSKLYNVGAGSAMGGGYAGGAYTAPVSNTEEMFVDPGTYYFKLNLEDSQNNFLDPFGDEPVVYHTNLQNYNLASEFIPDRPSSFSGAAQFKTPSGVTVAELNTSDLLNYNPTNSTQPGVNYWLDVNEPGNLSLKISSSVADRIQLQVKKLVGLEGENGAGEVLVDTGFVALDLTQPIELKNLNKGRYILEVLPRPSWDSINRQWIKQPYTQPFTINGIFSRQAQNPGEGQVPSNAGGFSKTVTSNGVDTHYYANGYLSVQPSGYATWYSYGAGVPLPTIPGATQPGASVPPFSTLGLGTATPVATVPPDYAGNSFNQARNIGVLNGTQTFQDFLGDADPSDYYRFELNNDSNLNWRVDGLTPGVDFQLYNNDFKLQWSTNTPAPNFSSDMAGTYPGTPGTYYIRLKPFASGGSNYNFSLSAIPRNTAPENLQFNLTSNSYNVGSTVELNGKVFDRNGASDISRVDFWLKQNGNDWQFFSRNQSLNRDAQWANFSLSVDDLATGNYELKATAYDQSGAESNTFTGAFQVTVPFDNNATQWFSNGKTLSGEMLAEYNRLVGQGNYLGNPSFVDTSPAKSYFGTDVQRAFFPSQNLGYTSLYKSQNGTFSLSGSIADYYTNYYFRKYDDPSGKNPYLQDGLFGIYSGLGVPISSVIRQADGSEVAYFEGGMLTNRNGVVTPNYNQNAKYFELVGQGAPNGTELQWKNDYGYWNPGSVGQPTGSVRRINNGWVQEFTASPKGDGDSIFLLKDGQSALGGLEKYIDNNGQQQQITTGGPYRVQGGILNAYRSVGGQDGILGFPTMSQERSNFNGYKVYQEFENGFIAETYDGRTIKRNWQGQDIWPNISANHWNARFINRNQGNVDDYSTYDYDFKNNPAAVVDLGYQKNSNDLISLDKDFGEGSPATGVQNDNFAMVAWTRTDLKAGKTYKITTQSDDGTFFKLKNVRTNEWFNPGGDWRDRSSTEPAKTIEFKVNESGEYDFHVQYYDRTGFSTINVNLEETQPFPTNPQPQPTGSPSILSQTPESGRGRLTGDTNFRTYPWANSSTLIQAISTGTTFTLLEKVTTNDSTVAYRNWYRVRLNDGREGYFWADNVQEVASGISTGGSSGGDPRGNTLPRTGGENTVGVNASQISSQDPQDYIGTVYSLVRPLPGNENTRHRIRINWGQMEWVKEEVIPSGGLAVLYQKLYSDSVPRFTTVESLENAQISARLEMGIILNRPEDPRETLNVDKVIGASDSWEENANGRPTVSIQNMSNQEYLKQSIDEYIRRLYLDNDSNNLKRDLTNHPGYKNHHVGIDSNDQDKNLQIHALVGGKIAYVKSDGRTLINLQDIYDDNGEYKTTIGKDPVTGETRDVYQYYRYNNVVVIWNPDLQRAFVYLHFDKVGVNQGDWVNPGDILGIEGSTGASTGNHTHVEVRTDLRSYEDAQLVTNGTLTFNLVEDPRKTIGIARANGILDKRYNLNVRIRRD
ncbi:S8 family serine peptidase [Argonema antarcticum]|uniref:S8 family serine peptidase n=1 Tax=Argonema antarcticum TaxID=2942763 RepID=UPI0020115696|nr:S8 family serine peptidase [Argonema antarcticum A004/B2]